MKPSAWMDEYGNTFPLKSYDGGKQWIDEHKHGWTPLYALPPGYAIVPIEPTPEMLYAVWPAYSHGSGVSRGMWKAMIAAAQKEQS